MDAGVVPANLAAQIKSGQFSPPDPANTVALCEAEINAKGLAIAIFKKVSNTEQFSNGVNGYID